MSSKIGRNDPCPCGSGLKYKRCCAHKDRQQPGGNGQGAGLPPNVQAMIDGLKQQPFESIEDAQAAADSGFRALNANPVDDFAGLSPHEMHQVLYSPFDAPGLLLWPDPLGVVPTGEAIELATGLAEGLGSKGVKRTAKDNLPRQLCRDLLARWQSIDGEDPHFGPGRLQSELDYRLLHRVRLTMELSGLIRKHSGRFMLTRSGSDRLARNGPAGLYPPLLKAYAQQLNWAYDDGLPEVPMLQQCFMFTLHLLQQFGDAWRPTTFYADAVLRAFPPLIRDFTEDHYFSAEERFRRAYMLRTLARFAAPLGLIEFEPFDPAQYKSPRQIRRLPLLAEVVQFR